MVCEKEKLRHVMMTTSSHAKHSRSVTQAAENIKAALKNNT
jgi:hypothetical protein